MAKSALLAALTVAVFDVIAWFVVPPSYTVFSGGYRKTQLVEHGAIGQPAMTRNFARHYFRADPALGFDIRPGASGTEEVDNVPYRIFANSLGCFDANELAAFRAAPAYHYFAGDSFTWGFAEYESKFATVWERETGKVAAKCGVTHTGQAHQLEKLTRFASAVGKYPATVFVGYYVNDPINDEGHPHTTVVSGYLVDTVFLKAGALVRADSVEVAGVVEASIRQMESARPGALERAKTRIWVYSLSANMVWHAIGAAQRLWAGGPEVAGPASLGPTARFGDNLYKGYDPRTMKTLYANDPMTAANRREIVKWSGHAREHAYRLVFLLFPPKSSFDDPAYFAQVRAFLDSHGIEHLDFAPLFRAQRLGVKELYWAQNDHWHPAGNRIVGRMLAERYR